MPLVSAYVGVLTLHHNTALKNNSRCQCIFAGSEGEGSEVQISRLLQILREFASDPILSDYVIDAVWQGMDAIKAIFTLLSVNFLII